MQTQIKTEYQDCLDACQRCIVHAQVCLTEMARKESKNDCPVCCVQCIDACLVCVKMLSVNSQWSKKYCSICAEVCRWCAEQCSQHDMAVCQQCAESCRECMKECLKIAA